MKWIARFRKHADLFASLAVAFLLVALFRQSSPKSGTFSSMLAMMGVSVPAHGKETRCCACSSTWNPDTDLFPYIPSTCERRGHHYPYNKCELIIVEGGACTYSRMSYDAAGKVQCDNASVSYHYEGEEEKPRKLAAPSISTCATFKVGNFRKAPVAEAQKSDPGDIVCTCGRDPTDVTRCVGSRIVRGFIDQTDSRPLRPGETCTAQVCGELFPESTVPGQCPRYEQGTP